VPYKDIEEKGKEDGIKYFLVLILIIIGIVSVLLVPETFGDIVMVLRIWPAIEWDFCLTFSSPIMFVASKGY
jgi:nitrate reductase NapE component